MQRRASIKIGIAALLAVALAGCMSPDGVSADAKRTDAHRMRSETLAKLYTLYPDARERVAKAEGYGVFSNVGVNLILLSAGNGWGVVRDNKSGKDVYMKMLSGGIGLGLGVKDFRGVFVFTSRGALEDFIEHGWDSSGQADAAAKSGDKGDAVAGAIDVAPGIRLYQITEHGLALQATIQGTKYWRDSELNQN
jgi:lipid-binding SYLF domain-containing protein